MSQITLNVFDILTRRQAETIPYEYGYGNFTKLKMELAIRRNITQFDDIILKNSDGKAIKNQDELEDQQQIWFDCPNPIYNDSKKKQHQLSISKHIITLKTQINSQQSLQQKNFLKSIQLSINKSQDKKFQLNSKVIDQKYEMERFSRENISTTFETLEESKSYLFEDRKSSKSERDIRNFENEISSVIGKEKLKRASVQLEVMKSIQQANLQKNQDEISLKLINEYQEKMKQNHNQIKQVDEQILSQFELIKKAKQNETLELLDKLKHMEAEKKKRIQEQQLIIKEFHQNSEEIYRYKIFTKVSIIKNEMKQITNSLKTLPESNLIDKIKPFVAKIDEIEKLSKEKTQQMQQ